MYLLIYFLVIHQIYILYIFFFSLVKHYHLFLYVTNKVHFFLLKYLFLRLVKAKEAGGVRFIQK